MAHWVLEAIAVWPNMVYASIVIVFKRLTVTLLLKGTNIPNVGPVSIYDTLGSNSKFTTFLVLKCSLNVLYLQNNYWPEDDCRRSWLRPMTFCYFIG